MVKKQVITNHFVVVFNIDVCSVLSMTCRKYSNTFQEIKIIISLLIDSTPLFVPLGYLNHRQNVNHLLNRLQRSTSLLCVLQQLIYSRVFSAVFPHFLNQSPFYQL